MGFWFSDDGDIPRSPKMLIFVAWCPRLTMQMSGPVVFLFSWCRVFIPRKKWKATYQWISWNRLIIVVYTSSCPDVCGFLPPKDLPISCGWHSHSHVALRCPVLQEGTPLAGMEAPAIPRSPRSSGAQGWRWCHGLLCEVGLFHCVKYGLWYGNTKS